MTHLWGKRMMSTHQQTLVKLCCEAVQLQLQPVTQQRQRRRLLLLANSWQINPPGSQVPSYSNMAQVMLSVLMLQWLIGRQHLPVLLQQQV